jgi:hypothetical protein
MKIRIHSGGQTGADLAGLWVAKKMGLPTGGFAPEDFKTQAGNKPALKELFGLKAFGSGYRSRTIQNVKDSDLTLIFARNMESPGTVLTKNSCMKLVKQSFSIPDNRHEGETLRQYWADVSPDNVGRHLVFFNALSYMLKKAERQKQTGLDDYFIINIAGNATKKTIPEIFDFTFVSLWYLLMLYSHGLKTLGVEDTNFTADLVDIDPVDLAARLRDRYGEDDGTVLE